MRVIEDVETAHEWSLYLCLPSTNNSMQYRAQTIPLSLVSLDQRGVVVHHVAVAILGDQQDLKLAIHVKWTLSGSKTASHGLLCTYRAWLQNFQRG